MRTLVSALSAFIALGIATAAHAQPPQTPPGQAKKQTAPKQTADHGTGDAEELTPADQELLQRLFGKNESAVVLTPFANGGVRLELDESFQEAITVTIADDGSLKFSHLTGLANATEAVKAASPNTTATKPVTALEEK